MKTLSNFVYESLERDDKLSPEDQLKEWLKNQNYENYIDILNQILKDHSDLLQAFSDPKFGDVKLHENAKDLPVFKLIPTQNEIDISKSISYGFGKSKAGIAEETAVTNLTKYYGPTAVELNAPIIVFKNSRNYYVIDGHHRWSQVFCWNPDAKVKCLVFENPKLEPINMLKLVQGVIAKKVSKTSKEIPVSTVDGQNLFDLSKKEMTDILQGYIDDFNKATNADWNEVYNRVMNQLDLNPVDNPIELIVDNCIQMQKKNPPINDAPNRGLMPQTDNKNASGALDLLKADKMIKVKD